MAKLMKFERKAMQATGRTSANMATCESNPLNEKMSLLELLLYWSQTFTTNDDAISTSILEDLLSVMLQPRYSQVGGQHSSRSPRWVTTEGFHFLRLGLKESGQPERY